MAQSWYQLVGDDVTHRVKFNPLCHLKCEHCLFQLQSGKVAPKYSIKTNLEFPGDNY